MRDAANHDPVRSSQVVSTLVRAKVSRNEWQELRKLAIEQNTSPADLAGRAIRELLQLHGKPTEGSVRV